MSEATKFDTTPVEVETPLSGRKVTLKGFVTARMQLATRGVFLRYTKLNMKAAQGKSQEEIKKMDQSQLTSFADEIPAEVINEINELTVQHMVLKIDGNEVSPEEALKICLDEMPPEDYEFVIEQCNEISARTSLSDDSKKK